LEITEGPQELPQGEVDILLVYRQRRPEVKRPSPEAWPVLDGGRYLGGTLRREELYGDDGR